jgi:hypothetical protein
MGTPGSGIISGRESSNLYQNSRLLASRMVLRDLKPSAVFPTPRCSGAEDSRGMGPSLESDQNRDFLEKTTNRNILYLIGIIYGMVYQMIFGQTGVLPGLLVCD